MPDSLLTNRFFPFMFDPWMLLAFLAHAAVLAGLVVWACRRLAMPWRDWPFAVYIIVWASLVLAGHMASLLTSLGRLTVYVPLTLLAVGMLLALFRYVERGAGTPLLPFGPRISFARVRDGRTRRFIAVFLGVTLAFAALASVVLAMSVYPDNADSMIYRLPRAFWYVSKGSFLHPFDSIDKRITFYPLNGVAMYVPLVLYNLPGTFHSLPSVAAWFMLAYVAYRFARALGAERLIAFFAAWLVVLTPGVLAQATSTNDEIYTAVVLLVGLFMGWRWLATGRRGYFLLMATAFGLSVGTKLHILFLTPVILAALGLAAWHAARQPDRLRRWFGAIGWRAGAAGFGVAAVMAVPFLFYNYASTGRFYFFDDFAREVFNLKGSLHGFLQNLAIYTAQMVFSPIADLNIWPVANDRQHVNFMLNAIVNPLIKPFISDDPSFYHMAYRFVGVTLPVSVRFVEFSLWSGFVWLLWPIQASLVLKKRFPLRGLFLLIALTPPLWLLFWSATTLYMEGTATYFTFYLICAAPASVFSFAAIRNALGNEIRWVAIVLVAITNVVIGTNMLMFSGFRALPDLYHAKTWPYDWDLLDAAIVDEIRRAEDIRIAFIHEKMPYFAFMHWHPNARYHSPYPLKDVPNIDKVLQLLPVTSLDRYGFVVLKVPGKPTKGVTYLGTMRGIGREAIFASGNGVERRYPNESDYIIPVVHIVPSTKSVLVRADKNVAGLSPDDRLEFRYELAYANKTIFSRDWHSDPGFQVNVEPDGPLAKPFVLTVAVRSARDRKELTRATANVGGDGSWLPQGDDY
jgi:hypothetical protein